MITQSQSPARLAFGPFEVNPAAEELLRDGARVRLSGQPFQILLMLLAKPGEVVTREELREQIWSEGTFVDFEHGLNAAMNKLRRALGDSAERPRYIETIPGRGYRFVGNLAQPAAISEATALSEPGQVTSGRRVPRPLIWVLLAMVAILGVWRLVERWRARPERAGTVQFAIQPPEGAIFSPPISRQSFAISPDGRRLAFTSSDGSGTRVWIRELESLEPRPVAGTEGAWTVFWSKDSRSIFYTVKRMLRQVNLDTGTTRDVVTLPWMAMNGTWKDGSGNDDPLLYVYAGPSSVYEISVKTGSARELPPTNFRWAEFLPDGEHYLHVDFDPAVDRYSAVATELATGRSKSLMETDSRVQYAPPRQAGEPGYLLFVRGGSLLAQAFDAGGLRLIGEPLPLAQRIVYFRPSASACFSVSENGVLVYQSGFPVSEIRWYDRMGRVVSATQAAPFSGTVRVSPDGHRVAADVWSPESGVRDVWVYGDNGRESRRLTYPHPPETHVRPVWSPDGRRIAFGLSHTSSPHLATVTTDESNREGPLAEGEAAMQPGGDLQIPTDWSRDGRFVAYDTSLGEEERAVWVMDTGDGRIWPLLKNEASQWGGAFSPDGQEIAFVSDESGRPEVYVQGFAAEPTPHVVGERRQVSPSGGWLVRWRPDGHELFYLGVDAWLYAVPVEGGVAGEPKALFQVPGNPQYGTATDVQFDVEPGGQRFVMTTAGAAAPPAFTVVENWQERLRR